MAAKPTTPEAQADTLGTHGFGGTLSWAPRRLMSIDTVDGQNPAVPIIRNIP